MILQYQKKHQNLRKNINNQKLLKIKKFKNFMKISRKNINKKTLKIKKK